MLTVCRSVWSSVSWRLWLCQRDSRWQDRRLAYQRCMLFTAFTFVNFTAWHYI